MRRTIRNEHGVITHVLHGHINLDAMVPPTSRGGREGRAESERRAQLCIQAGVVIQTFKSVSGYVHEYRIPVWARMAMLLVGASNELSPKVLRRLQQDPELRDAFAVVVCLDRAEITGRRAAEAFILEIAR